LPLSDFKESEKAGLRVLQDSLLGELDDIEYQQTYTSGWSGTLKVPVAEGTMSGQGSFSPRSKTYPEIVGKFKVVLRRIVTQLPDRCVIIGIDELDKIEEPVRARAFLNEIKGIFGVQQCYFLVAVSLDALSAYGRRGMPIRDAFDSAFDEILEVPTLSYLDATRVIERRTVGMSVPFIALAYVVSGGLARDLIRVARRITIVARTSVDNRMSTIAARVVGEEARSKFDASVWALRMSNLDPYSSSIVRTIRDSDIEDSAGLLELAEALCTLLSQGPAFDSATSELTREMASYAYFGATVLEVFGRDFDVESFHLSETTGLLDKLASARQRFVSSTDEVWSDLNSIRAAIDKMCLRGWDGSVA
jgi:hypothetical protein